MADFETINRTIGGVDDQRIIVDNVHAPLVRTMSIGDNWSSLRIAVRLTNLQYTPPIPFFYLGLCHGTSSPPGTGSPEHFYGFRAGPNATLYSTQVALLMSSNSSKECLIQSGSESVHSTNLGSTVVSANVGNNGSIIVLNISKGSPWTLETWIVNSQTSATRFQTLEQFKEILNTPTRPSGYSSYTSSGLTPDEGTYGALDSICCVFLGASNGFEISDIGYARLA